jgi:hypothetical protein
MRISQWGLDKNVKPNEMKAIVKKRQQRRLVETDKGELVFRVRGRVVGPEKVDGWMKRNGIPGSMLYCPSPAACKRAFHFTLPSIVSASRANMDSYPYGAQHLHSF